MIITASLKDALRRRPGLAGEPSTSRTWTGAAWVDYRGMLIPSNLLPDNVVKLREPVVTCKPMWTPAQYRAFERLTAMVCSPVISERARAQVWLKKFQEKNGHELCDMMLAEIRRRDEQEWFADKSKRRGA